MHAVRDGSFWNTAPKPEATNESYDLVVVGGGISGLAAALLYGKLLPLFGGLGAVFRIGLCAGYDAAAATCEGEREEKAGTE